jgi:hypothetical protein
MLALGGFTALSVSSNSVAELTSADENNKKNE